MAIIVSTAGAGVPFKMNKGVSMCILVILAAMGCRAVD